MIKFIAVLTYQLLQLKIVVKLSLLPSFFMLIIYYISSFAKGLLPKDRLSLLERVLNWYMNNEDYIFLVLATIIVAHFLGTWKYFKLRQFDLKKNILGFFVMLIIAITGAFIFEAMNIIVHRESALKDYLVIVTRLIIFLYPARSAWRSMSVVSNGKFPPKSWIDKMDKFEGSLNIGDILNKEEKEKFEEELKQEENEIKR